MRCSPLISVLVSWPRSNISAICLSFTLTCARKNSFSLSSRATYRSSAATSRDNSAVVADCRGSSLHHAAAFRCCFLRRRPSRHAAAVTTGRTSLM